MRIFSLTASVSVSEKVRTGGRPSGSLSVSVVVAEAVFVPAGGGESASTEAVSSTSMSAALTPVTGW